MAFTNYFLSNQHAIDHYTINWNRFSLYFIIVWLLSFSCYSTGQLLGTIFVDHTQLAITLAVLGSIVVTMFNGMMVNLDRSGNDMLITLGNMIGHKFLTKSLFITFYGFGRCPLNQNSSSIYFRYFEIDEQLLWWYLLRVMINIILIRAIILFFMFLKFNNYKLFSLSFLLNLLPSTTSSLTLSDIDISNEKNNHNHNDIIKDSKILIEEEFNNQEKQQLSQKICEISIGWRNLSLFKQSSSLLINNYDDDKQHFNSKTMMKINNNKIDNNVDNKRILHNLNGEFYFGTLNALMGTSGAGKTSLLRVLNGQCRARLSKNTTWYVSNSRKIETCFIKQEVSEHLMSGLTARQLLIYASRLKNIDYVTSSSSFSSVIIDHEKIALSLLNQLDLLDTLDTRLEQCSGGERKRLALAAELTPIVMPNLICIDEPTSGLDSNSAEIVSFFFDFIFI